MKVLRPCKDTPAVDAQGAEKFSAHAPVPSVPTDTQPAVRVRQQSKLKLRQQAEEVLCHTIKETQEHIDSLSPASLRTILHELRIHQIELEMQNEELHRTQAELSASRDRFFELYDWAPTGFMTISEPGLILEANLTSATLLGVAKPDLVKQSFARCLFREDQDIFHRAARHLFETGEPQACDLRMVKRDGSMFWAQVNATLSRDEGDAPVLLIALSDVSERKSADEALRRASDLLNKTGEMAKVGGWQLDLATQKIEWTEETYRIHELGADYQPHLNAGLSFYPPESRPIIEAAVKRAIGHGERFDLEVPFVTARGNRIWVKATGESEHKDGECIRLSGTFQDITKRKNAEAELLSLRTAVAQCGHAIVITDPCGKIVYANPSFEKSTGYSAAEVVGQSHGVLRSGEQDEAFFEELWSTIRAGGVWRGELHSKRKDGEVYWEDVTISPVRNDKDETLYFIAIKEDITERKAMEASLDKALKEARAAAAAKGEFLTVMSHELRTPLNGILGFTELLADTPLNDEQHEYARTISSSGNHLLSIVNDVLDFSSLGRGSISIDTVLESVAGIVEASVLAARKAAGDKMLEFRCETDIRVPRQITCDARRISQILINLLGNAVKFTSSGSVVLRIAPASAAGRQFLDFSVQDTGIGIPPETLERLFKPFIQGDSGTRRKFGGTGLGLAISKSLAEAMGGGITVISTPGEGSTFTFSLPLDVPLAASP